MNEKNIVVLSSIVGSVILLIAIDVSYLIFHIADSDFKLTDKIEYCIKIFTAGGLIFGGLIGAFNVYYAAKRAYAMEITAEATNKNAEAAIAKQITDRFSKAIEQLGNYKIEIRLGGIYTLERIGRDSKEDHWTVMEVLAAFVRENSNKLNYSGKKLGLDIQEAITVIIRLFNKHDQTNKILDLSNTNISGVVMKDMCITNINFEGTNFTNSILSKVIFTNSNLERTDFTKALIIGTSFISNNSLKDINFINTEFKNTNFTKENLAGANFNKAKFIDVNFIETVFKSNSYIENCDATFSEATIIMSNFINANLIQIDFRKATLTSVNFKDTDLAGTNFMECYLENIDLNLLKSAKNWDIAKYDDEFRIRLGLPPEYKSY